jgi:hypothetical protein
MAKNATQVRRSLVRRGRRRRVTNPGLRIGIIGNTAKHPCRVLRDTLSIGQSQRHIGRRPPKTWSMRSSRGYRRTCNLAPSASVSPKAWGTTSGVADACDAWEGSRKRPHAKSAAKPSRAGLRPLGRMPRDFFVRQWEHGVTGE